MFCGNPTLATRRDCDKSVRHILCHIFSDKVVTMLLYTCENCKVIFYILCMYSVLFCVVKGRKEGFLELVVMCQVDKFATAQIVPSAPGGCWWWRLSESEMRASISLWRPPACYTSVLPTAWFSSLTAVTGPGLSRARLAPSYQSSDCAEPAPDSRNPWPRTARPPPPSQARDKRPPRLQLLIDFPRGNTLRDICVTPARNIAWQRDTCHHSPVVLRLH